MLAEIYEIFWSLRESEAGSIDARYILNLRKGNITPTEFEVIFSKIMDEPTIVLESLGVRKSEINFIFLSALESQDAQIRHQAINKLIGNGRLIRPENVTPEVIDALASVLQDQDLDMREAAVQSLVYFGNIPSHITLEIVKIALQGNDYVSNIAAEKLKGSMSNVV